MEGIAAASTVVQLIDFSGKILAAGYGFLSKVVRAPAEIRMLLNEIANINTLLDRMQTFATTAADPGAHTALQALSLRGTFDDCEQSLKAAQKCLDACKQSDGEQVKNFGRALRWPLTEREMKDTMQKLRVLQDQLTAALTVDSAYEQRILRDLSRSNTNISLALPSDASRPPRMQSMKA